MAKTFRKTGKNGNLFEAVKNHNVKPQDFKTRFYASSDDPREWRKFQKNVRRRYPIARRVFNSIKILADDLQLEPQVVEFLEDCFRGFSTKMQVSMVDTLRVYICNGDLPTTGISHTDRLVKEMLSRIYNNK
ncbi:MAG: hypothetical protein IJ886_07915 [Prevotella sp.]|nr:hypothetical protein [Prevotella sp.]MBR2230175.1 hypothetical protein [Prevotella sp.]